MEILLALLLTVTPVLTASEKVDLDPDIVRKYGDLDLNIVHAIMDIGDADKVIDAFEKSEVPALKDKNHPDRQKTLNTYWEPIIRCTFEDDDKVIEYVCGLC